MPERSFPCSISGTGAVLACAAMVVWGAFGFVSGASAAATPTAPTLMAAMAQGGTSVPDSSSPEESPPDATEPPPDETPDATEPPPDETPEAEPLPPAPSEAEDDNLIAGVVAIAGFTLLVGIAGWWMVRRRDIDDGPPPPPSPDAGVAGRDLI